MSPPLAPFAPFAPSYSAVTVTPATRASYNARAHDCDGAASDREARHAIPRRPPAATMDHTHSQEYVPQCQHDLHLVAIAPSKSTPRPPDLSLRSSTASRTELARSVARIACGTQSPPTDRAQCLLSRTPRSPSRSRPSPSKSNGRAGHAHPVGSGATGPSWMALMT